MIRRTYQQISDVQLYTNCIRQEMNHCSIAYSAVDSEFQVSSTTLATVTRDQCSDDYITIPDGADSLGSNNNFAR